MGKPGAKIIIVKKKIKGHGGHHGGSWKVAYADFVTAMMAFFMVMWILGMDQNVRQAIEGYFSNPVGFKKGYSAGSSPISAGASPATVKTTAITLASRKDQERRFKAVSESIERNVATNATIAGVTARVEVVVTDAGLRIELVEGPSGDTFFPFASAELTTSGRMVLGLIGKELVGLSNPVTVEGHTDAAQFASRTGYTNWELSADRANAARRVLEANGLDRARVKEVRGLADRSPRVRDNPLDPSNRRITIFLPFVTPPALPTPPAVEAAPSDSAAATPRIEPRPAAPPATRPGE